MAAVEDGRHNRMGEMIDARDKLSKARLKMLEILERAETDQEKNWLQNEANKAAAQQQSVAGSA